MTRPFAFLLLLLLAVQAGYAQRKTVDAVAAMLQIEKPRAEAAVDGISARRKLAPALEHKETAAHPFTWYVAGMIGYRMAQQMSEQPDFEALGPALTESYDCFLHAAEAVKEYERPVVITYDEWVKYNSRSSDDENRLSYAIYLDSKDQELSRYKAEAFRKPWETSVDCIALRKELRGLLASYYSSQVFVSYASYLLQRGDSAGAYQALGRHIFLREQPLMKSGDCASVFKSDSAFHQLVYFTGGLGAEHGYLEGAVRAFSMIVSSPYNGAQACLALCRIYEARHDIDMLVATLETGAKYHPGEPWFLRNLVGYYRAKGDNAKAEEYARRLEAIGTAQ